jgi:hypothetical protein
LAKNHQIYRPTAGRGILDNPVAFYGNGVTRLSFKSPQGVPDPLFVAPPLSSPADLRSHAAFDRRAFDSRLGAFLGLRAKLILP